jgi:bacterioferritin-associated ferredoxin
VAVAAEFLRNRGSLLAVLDMSGVRDKLCLLTRAVHQISKIQEGALDLASLFLARVPLHHRTAVVEARGGSKLDSVVAARIGKHGVILEGSERVYRTDSLAVGYGFAPNIELAQVSGCAMEYDRDKGGWVVRVGKDLETGVSGIFAAGEITGIAGALKSLHEGELAAWGMLRKMGRDVDEKRLARLQRARARHLRFGKYFNALHRFPDRAILAIPDETTICRCEGVKMGDIRRAVREGHETPGAMKRALRIGMGHCQGRTCGPPLYDILSLLTRQPVERIPILSARSPVKPVAMRSFLR